MSPRFFCEALLFTIVSALRADPEEYISLNSLCWGPVWSARLRHVNYESEQYMDTFEALRASAQSTLKHSAANEMQSIISHTSNVIGAPSAPTKILPRHSGRLFKACNASKATFSCCLSVDLIRHVGAM